ncbi:MAG: tRNA pseudouridine(55) synthase TruB [Patescibacteria group bacterium]|nr:tRNA pseudouridine(55) synthase TruB [Patescibacteria group bacterium]
MQNPIHNEKLIKKISEDKNSFFLLVDKEPGKSSFFVIKQLRKITNIKKIGFSGTLDPIASGLLIIAISNATKFLDAFHFLNKIYTAKIELGKISDTYDTEGNIKNIKINKKPSLVEIKNIIDKNFIGDILQTPPIFSAKKIKGKNAYELARKGEEVKIKSVKIKIDDLKIKKYKYPFLELEISCSRGTYIRSIANDLGEKLKTGGILVKLKRSQIGNFNLKNAIKQKRLDKKIVNKSKLTISDIIKNIK